MSERVTMPALGESVTEGTVTRWLKNVGDRVEVDEPLLEVSTDKVDTEIPSPVAGTLQEILAQEDDTVPVGADLAVIGDGEAPASGGDAPAAEEAPEPEQAAPAPEAPSTEQEPQAATSEPEAEQAEAPQAAASSSGGGDGQTVTMPALGESVTEGTVTRWLKSEGDEVAVDEPLLEVSTDKVDTEIPSPVAGTLTKILVQEDDTVPVGADLAVIGGGAPAAAEAPAPAAEPEPEPEQAPEPEPQQAPEPARAETPAPAGASQAAETPAPQAQAEESAPAPAGKPADAERPPAQQSPEAPEAPAAAPAVTSSRDDAAAYVTPLVRKLAAQHGVDLGSITGPGAAGPCCCRARRSGRERVCCLRRRLAEARHAREDEPTAQGDRRPHGR